MKRTPLYSAHVALGGKLIPFGGWEMPVQYTGIADEHLAVRNSAGIFDISHMGEFMLRGRGVQVFLNHALTNDVAKLRPGLGQYTLMCNHTGGVVDDLYIYQLDSEEYLLIVNASRIAADLEWIQSLLKTRSATDCEVRDASAETGAVAVQGPAVAAFIGRCFSGPATGGTRVSGPAELKKNEIAEFDFCGRTVWVSRTGYTGEDGFEVVAPAGEIKEVWERVLDAGKEHGIKPAGLGARDTLRTEVCYPLYGHELDEQTSPIEAGLGYFTALTKPDFVGRATLLEQKSVGPNKKLVAFKMVDRGAPPRPDYPLLDPISGQKIGKVTSGTHSPSLNTGIGMGYVPAAQFAKPGTAVAVGIRGKTHPAVTVLKPVYQKQK